ncbi:hypothetical protein [Nannocystis sp.]|uniref:hypothetical protein n=1 Tax=Nannocystis sp. TaxID=1962667 RepID=UPI002425B71C|nr:hypothetical protein [Nannocystis sp.]MBK7826525.1 hypothetical protein [Nannocystis sp.]MBK9754147.1 hypothetical protein [Nannocystis sp.]
MLSVHDMPLRAQLPIAAPVQAKGLFAANDASESGRGRWFAGTAPGHTGYHLQASPDLRSE